MKCSVVIWFQCNLNLTLDLPYIIIKKLSVFLENGNLKFVKELRTRQSSFLTYNGKSFRKWWKWKSLPKKHFLFIPLNPSNRHCTLPFVNLKTKTLYILDLLTQRTNADLAKKASSQISFLRKNLVTQKDLNWKYSKSVSKKPFLKENKLYFKWLFSMNSSR